MQLVLDLSGGREWRPRERGRPPRYFFALLPDEEAKARIHRLAGELSVRFRASGELRGPDKYHVTLRGIAAPDGPFGQSIAMARAVADAIRRTSFAVMFNQAATFGKPHVTLFYDRTRREPIDVPELRWQVREFVLVESIDRRSYQILGSWPFD